MLNVDEDAVICDLAETYHIYDWRSLPLSMVATFCYGLGHNSRIKRKLTETEYTVEELMLMHIADALNILIWQNTADAQKGINRPKTFIEILNGNKEENNVQGFNSIEEFELTRKALLGGI